MNFHNNARLTPRHQGGADFGLSPERRRQNQSRHGRAAAQTLFQRSALRLHPPGARPRAGAIRRSPARSPGPKGCFLQASTGTILLRCRRRGASGRKTRERIPVTELDRLKRWAAAARRDVLAVYLAARDPRVPLPAKLLAAATAAYALSPIDLIPDFIPVIGYLDDIILLPLAVMLVVRLIPDDVMADLRKQADRRLSQPRPRSLIAAVVIVAVWVTVCVGAAWLALVTFRN